jgi:hypothetical protein
MILPETPTDTFPACTLAPVGSSVARVECGNAIAVEVRSVIAILLSGLLLVGFSSFLLISREFIIFLQL